MTGAKPSQVFVDLIQGGSPDTRSGCLRLFGYWWGGRWGEAWFVLESVEAHGNRLELGFEDGERLTITDPDGLQITDDVLRIERASRLDVDWFYAGLPGRANRRHSEYAPHGGVFPPEMPGADWTAAAVEIWSTDPGD